MHKLLIQIEFVCHAGALQQQHLLSARSQFWAPRGRRVEGREATPKRPIGDMYELFLADTRDVWGDAVCFAQLWGKWGETTNLQSGF